MWFDFTLKALRLHKANSSCGRPLVSLIFGLLILSCSSSTEEINPMESYYIESQGLVRTTIDSTLNFAHKYNHYVFNTPGAFLMFITSLHCLIFVLLLIRSVMR